MTTERAIPRREAAMVHRLITRSKTLPDAGGQTLFFTFMTRRLQFLRPEQVPEFDGDQAWFEIERVKGLWRVGRRTDERGKPL